MAKRINYRGYVLKFIKEDKIHNHKGQKLVVLSSYKSEYGHGSNTSFVVRDIETGDQWAWCELEDCEIINSDWKYGEGIIRDLVNKYGDLENDEEGDCE